MTIHSADTSQYASLIQIWEASVKASHDFLTTADIEALKPLILHQYFDAVDLRVIEHNQQIQGFIGTHEDNIEMLFISPYSQGQQLGKKLVQYAILNLNVTKVDVNEQNPKACGFYQHLGFQIIGCSALDQQHQPFPILHMQLINN